MFVPVASALTAIHRDHQTLASNIHWQEIQSLMSRGQIVSADFPYWTDGQTTTILYNDM